MSDADGSGPVDRLVGRQYVPSNGTEGYAFLESWCRHCARDKAMREGAEYDECDDSELCTIIAASFRGEAVEWRELDDGRKICTAYVEAGQPIPARCPNTLDLFDPLTPNYAFAQSELDGEHSTSRKYYVDSRDEARTALAAYLGIKEAK